ncbi:hypothetical protein KFK09_000038 [Dendrobium nobile]|uniref:Uncharacterized protein n=1 Tax=Dendrobium nobile TaxID=94219 RepID=A0A8T3C7E3_DENNO|nr:hypothetical protein KFK09_000038 [Dendrobium nobile]
MVSNLNLIMILLVFINLLLNYCSVFIILSFCIRCISLRRKLKESQTIDCICKEFGLSILSFVVFILSWPQFFIFTKLLLKHSSLSLSLCFFFVCLFCSCIF